MSRRMVRLVSLVTVVVTLVGVTMTAAMAQCPDPPRKINWSGHTWTVKCSETLVGPGPNYFSASPKCVRVDARGRLHMRIRYNATKNRWECPEIICDSRFGYATYRWDVVTPVQSIDPNATLGLFTWSDNPAYAYREIDIEAARWGNPANPDCLQYVVQPYDLAGHMLRFCPPPSVKRTSQLFKWTRRLIRFQTLGSHSMGLFAPPTMQNDWSFRKRADIPRPGDEHPRINLWLFRGDPPHHGKDVEVILKRFVAVRAFGAPDLAIANLPAGKYFGNNLYNTTGQGQTRSRKAAKGAKAKYYIRVQNDEAVPDRVVLFGAPGNDRFRVQYFLGCTGTKSITGPVKRGTWTSRRLKKPTDSICVRVEVTPRDGVQPGDMYAGRLRARSGKDPQWTCMIDLVKFMTTAKAGTSALQLSGLTAVPTAAGAQVAFSLSSAADVDALVLNIAGRPVRALCRRKSCAAGANTLLWNALNDNGLPAPNGVYLVEVVARGADGTQAKALTRVRIAR